MAATLLQRCEHIKKTSDFVVDLIFFDGAHSISTVTPWTTSEQEQWAWEWLPYELSHFSFRVFSANFRISKESWTENFPFLETSHMFIHKFKREKIGASNHFTFLFGWGIDTLLIKQLIYAAYIEQSSVCL